MSKNIVLEKAKLEDFYVLWKIRNNPRVKENCFNTSPVSLEEHKNWLADKISEENAEIYIAERNGKKIGSVRFEDCKQLEPSVSSVSVSIDSDFFGKGYGFEIIKFGTERFFREHAKNKIIARIKKDNIASQKAFGKAGYVKVLEKENEVIYEKHRINHS
ncbi:MAG: GNAT family N-acetyltransferase [Candidatus Omnitrophota bacterium]